MQGTHHGEANFPVASEDQARADFYALLARLYAAAPDAALLSAIAACDELSADAESEGGRALADAWRKLIAASTAMDPAAAADEYQTLFIGVGKSDVSAHGSAYVKSPGRNPLIEIRASLAELGLARQSGVNVYEDHLATVCETMRALITGAGNGEPFAFAQQREFFESHVKPWVFDCCTAIQNSPVANYYRRVAEFTQLFMAIERDSFAIE
ncbi:MAG TPA: molecular chaperone TorD family protein [Casimicrobiaceae bacterium]